MGSAPNFVAAEPIVLTQRTNGPINRESSIDISSDGATRTPLVSTAGAGASNMTCALDSRVVAQSVDLERGVEEAKVLAAVLVGIAPFAAHRSNRHENQVVGQRAAASPWTCATHVHPSEPRRYVCVLYGSLCAPLLLPWLGEVEETSLAID